MARRPVRAVTLETVVMPCRRADKGTVQAALSQLAMQDQLINLRFDDLRDWITVSLYGEVRKEVIEATLAHEYAARQPDVDDDATSTYG
jgi:ribosomal protection tetracycline resistance protein